MRPSNAIGARTRAFRPCRRPEVVTVSSDTPPETHFHASKARYASLRRPMAWALRRGTAGRDTRLAGFHDTGATPAVATTFLGEPISPDQHGVIAAVGLHQPSVSKSAVCPSETREVGDISPAKRLSRDGDSAINADRRNNRGSAATLGNPPHSWKTTLTFCSPSVWPDPPGVQWRWHRRWSP